MVLYNINKYTLTYSAYLYDTSDISIILSFKLYINISEFQYDICMSFFPLLHSSSKITLTLVEMREKVNV